MLSSVSERQCRKINFRSLLFVQQWRFSKSLHAQVLHKQQSTKHDHEVFMQKCTFLDLTVYHKARHLFTTWAIPYNCLHGKQTNKPLQLYKGNVQFGLLEEIDQYTIIIVLKRQVEFPLWFIGKYRPVSHYSRVNKLCSSHCGLWGHLDQ